MSERTPFDFPPRPASLDRREKRALVRIYTRKRKQRPCGVSARVVTQLEAMGLAIRRYGEIDTTGKGSRAARENMASFRPADGAPMFHRTEKR